MIRGVSLRQGLICVWCLGAVGCAEVTSESPHDATGAAETAAVDTAQSSDVALPSEPASPAAVADVRDTTADHAIADPIDAAPLSTGSDPELPTGSTGDIALERASEPVAAPEASTVREFAVSPSLVPPLVESPASAETLDFSSLVARLRKTKAINLRTKVAVKNESDELLEQFRAYHTQTGDASLAELRRAYDSLFHQLHSLLERSDPPLARDIDRSQAAIWELLADPTKFRASALMAGA